VICDAGRKALSTDAVPPRPVGLEGVVSVGLSAEHGKLELAAPSPTPRLGDRIAFLVGYADTTVPLHDEAYGVRDGAVAAVWPVAARGRLR
jgi:D-serine deaminase-like pyridoxal phosphate-dependent protein